MNKHLISPIFGMIAMILLLISIVFSEERRLDWLAYLAIILIIIDVFVIYNIVKTKPK